MTDTLIPAKDEAAAEIDRLSLRTQPFIAGEFRDAIGEMTDAVGDMYVTRDLEADLNSSLDALFGPIN